MITQHAVCVDAVYAISKFAGQRSVNSPAGYAWCHRRKPLSCASGVLNIDWCDVGTSQDDEDDEADIALQSGVQALNHKRGMAPYVFVPWHDVATSQLNLPVEQMDMCIPG